MIKLKKLEQELDILSTFENPNSSLEQYSTSPHIASRILHTAETQYHDIYNRTVADLGTGCGILSIGAYIMGASQVMGFDIDPSVLQEHKKNCEKLEISIETVCCDVVHSMSGKFEKMFDTVLMNPPFGTKNNAGIDMKFLEIASLLSTSSIYSFHKTSTRPHVLKKGKQLGFKSEVLAALRYDLPQTYKFHRKKSVDIAVDFIRFSIDK